MKNISKIAFLILAVSLFTNNLSAKDAHKVVIQISTDDKKGQILSLNNAVNLQKHYGMDNIIIEVVAYGLGLSAFTTDFEDSKRIKSLALQNIQFSACSNTMEKYKKDTGKDVVLTEGVKQVTAGIARIVDLQEEGYSYIRP